MQEPRQETMRNMIKGGLGWRGYTKKQEKQNYQGSVTDGIFQIEAERRLEGDSRCLA